MIKIKRILCIVLMFCFIGTAVYGFTYEPLNEDIIDNLEEDYGINIIIPNNEDITNYRDCLMVLDRGLRRFPEGVVREITEFYSDSGISTNVMVGKTERISDLFSEYKLDEKNADLYIYTMQNNLYYDTCVASEEGFIHEMGQYVRDYLFKVYGYDKIKSEFEKLNVGYKYGTWGEGYDKVFINKHSAISFNAEIADIIWYTEAHPDILRNINDGNYTVVHKKIEYLASIIDQCFSSITCDTRLWQDALPQKPDEWALDAIKAMEEASLIPEELDGVYNSYITKEDFYILTLNIVENKLGKEKFTKSFELTKQEDYVAIDPVKGEIYVDSRNGNSNLNAEACNEKEKRLNEAYQIGFMDEDMTYDSGEYITRLEMVKLLSYIGNELGMDISDYEAVDYDDISEVKDSDKPFIYFAASKGLLRGDGTNIKPYDYCTYQETYLMLMKFYNLL
jgi:hypothetical protein